MYFRFDILFSYIRSEFNDKKAHTRYILSNGDLDTLCINYNIKKKIKRHKSMGDKVTVNVQLEAIKNI